MGGDLIFYLHIRSQPAISGPVIALRGKHITLYTTSGSPDPNQWSGVSPKLYAPGWRVNHFQDGPIATDGQLAEVLSDLRGIYIMASWQLGAPDETHLDSVFMSGSPEPEGCEGDLNGDGDVTVADFNILAGNFGCISSETVR